MKNPPKADCCIEIQFEKGSKDPARVFRTMQGLIETFQELDRSLVKSIDSNIEPILILEDIESGSIKSWLSHSIKAIDDEAFKKMDWRPAVGKYLVKAKWLVIDYLDGKTQITDFAEVKQLEAKIHEVAKESDVKWLSMYENISTKSLLHSIEKISSSLSHLNKNDTASYLADDKKASFNLSFNFAPESIDELLTKEKISSKSIMILKIKKPDYLGESKWDFRHGGRNFPAKISHKEWLVEFQNREIDIRPGDSIRADVETIDKYDFNDELIGTDYNILRVIDVESINSPKQIELFNSIE